MTKYIRLENLLIGFLALFAYWQIEASWWLFAALILVTDISILAYLINNRIGALIYNIFHAYVGPIVLILVGWTSEIHLLLAIGQIWVVHNGLDRVLGYGLKHNTGFFDTHLGRIGRGQKR